MDAQFLRNPSNALPLRRTDPPSDIRLDRLFVATHRIAPSSPLVKCERGGEPSIFLADGDPSLFLEFSGISWIVSF